MTQEQIGHQKTVNITTTPVEKARDYARQRFKEFNSDIREVLPNFNRNYILMQSYLQKYSKNIPRYEMPVIEPKDMEDFERRLETGKIDIFKPYAKKHGFPKEFKDKNQQDYFLEAGQKDGHVYDDAIPVTIVRPMGKQLKPLQNQVWLNLTLKYILQYGVPHQASPVVNTTIIISNEYYIIDGHHRWSQVMISNPNLQMKCLLVPFNIQELLKIGRSYGAAIGNKPNF